MVEEEEEEKKHDAKYILHTMSFVTFCTRLHAKSKLVYNKFYLKTKKFCRKNKVPLHFMLNLLQESMC